MQKRYLICNADDFGRTRGATDAIIDCHANGVLTSTTLMTNMPAAQYACERAREFPALGVGVHMTLSEGQPLSAPEQVSELVDGQGRFLSAAVQRRQLWCGRKIAGQVEREFSAQVERALELGITPTHADSHHAIHKMPVACQAMIAVLKRYDIHRVRGSGMYYWVGSGASVKLRLMCMRRNAPMALRLGVYWWNAVRMRMAGVRSPDYKINREMLLPIRANAKDQLLACLASLPDGVSEMIFHPAYVAADGPDAEDYDAKRREDTVLAADPEVRSAIAQHGIELINFRDI